MQVKKQQLELDTEQKTGSKSGKEHVKAEYCHPAYLTYMWNAGLDEAKLESRLRDFIFGGAPKSLQLVTAAMKLNNNCSLEEKLWPI